MEVQVFSTSDENAEEVGETELEGLNGKRKEGHFERNSMDINMDYR